MCIHMIEVEVRDVGGEDLSTLVCGGLTLKQ